MDHGSEREEKKVKKGAARGAIEVTLARARVCG